MPSTFVLEHEALSQQASLPRGLFPREDVHASGTLSEAAEHACKRLLTSNISGIEVVRLVAGVPLSSTTVTSDSGMSPGLATTYVKVTVLPTGTNGPGTELCRCR